METATTYMNNLSSLISMPCLLTHASITVGQLCMNLNTSQIFFYNVNIIVMALYILNYLCINSSIIALLYLLREILNKFTKCSD